MIRNMTITKRVLRPLPLTLPLPVQSVCNELLLPHLAIVPCIAITAITISTRGSTFANSLYARQQSPQNGISRAGDSAVLHKNDINKL